MQTPKCLTPSLGLNILRAVVFEFRFRRAGDANPLIIARTKDQGTDVLRSPQFSQRSDSPTDRHVRFNRLLSIGQVAAGVKHVQSNGVQLVS